MFKTLFSSSKNCTCLSMLSWSYRPDNYISLLSFSCLYKAKICSLALSTFAWFWSLNSLILATSNLFFYYTYSLSWLFSFNCNSKNSIFSSIIALWYAWPWVYFSLASTIWFLYLLLIMELGDGTLRSGFLVKEGSVFSQSSIRSPLKV